MSFIPKILVTPDGLDAELAALVDGYFAAIGQGLNAYILRQQKAATLRHLDSMSDAELADMGLTRAGIPGHVFGDILSP